MSFPCIGVRAAAQSLPANLLERIPSPESASWEHWIDATLDGENPPRPDGKAKMAALPAWVDCHLSWRLDQPKKDDRKIQIPSEIILRANPKICDGQLEEWAR